jgi:hypothetical protein
MCYVPSTVVFCSESIECFPGTASKFFLKLLVTIPVAPISGSTFVVSLYTNSCFYYLLLLYVIIIIIIITRGPFVFIYEAIRLPNFKGFITCH